MEQLGSKFVQKLQQIGVPGCDKLDSSSTDWLFISSQNAPLAEFVSWFCDHITTSDILSKEELIQYAELEKNGEVLHGEQLESMSACLAELRPSLPVEAHGFEELSTGLSQEQELIKLQEDLKALEKHTQRVNLRNDQLSMESLKLTTRYEELNNSLEIQQRRVSQQQAMAFTASQELCQSNELLANAAHKLAELIKHNIEPNSTCVAALDTTEWIEQEQLYSEAVQDFINKQFFKGDINSVICGENSTGDELFSDCEVDEDLSLVIGSTPAQHSAYSAQLLRLHDAIRESEHNAVKEKVRRARLEGEIREANEAMEKLRRGHYGELSSDAIQQEIQSGVIQQRVAEEEVDRLQRTVDELVKQTSMRHTTETLTAHSLSKSVRQKYTSRKYKQVQDYLVQQLSRQDYFNILLQCEGEKVRHSAELLQSACEFLKQQYSQTLAQTEYLKKLSDDNEVRKVTGAVPPSLTTATLLLTSDPGTHLQRFIDALSQLLQERDEALLQLNTQQQPNSYKITKLVGKCELLEKCLSGSNGLPPSLPSSWLSPNIIDRQEEVEVKAHDFKMAMMELLKQFENKKQMAASQPELMERLQNWCIQK